MRLSLGQAFQTFQKSPKEQPTQSIDKYTCWQLTDKNRQMVQGQSLQYQFFILHLNKPNNDKFSYSPGSVLQSWEPISYRISAVFFDFRILQKSYFTTTKVILRSFCKNFFHHGCRKTEEIFVDHQFLNIFYITNRSFLFDSMPLNVEVSLFSSTLNPLSSSLFILWFTALALNIQRGKMIELVFNKVINGAPLIRAFNCRLAVSIIDFVRFSKFKFLSIIIPRSFCSASSCKVFLYNSIDLLAMPLFHY